MKKLLYLLAVLPLLFLYACGGKAQNLKEGDKAPEFSLQDVTGQNYSLHTYKGVSPVVLYFYPKAGTSGCTKEACGFRDNISKFMGKNIAVLGVSVDSKAEIKKFIDEYHLNFPLLSDESKEVSKAYGVLNKLGMDSRVTFIIDKEGKINKVMRDVDVTTHSEDVYKLVAPLI